MKGLPWPLGPPFSLLKTAFVSDGSFSITTVLFIWVIYEVLVAHTKCAFYRGAGVGYRSRSTVPWRAPRPQPRSHGPHCVPV